MSDQTSCFLWLDAWWACRPPSEWASWVQALGSIAAIVGMAWATRHQIRSARRAANEQVERARTLATEQAQAERIEGWLNAIELLKVLALRTELTLVGYANATERCELLRNIALSDRAGILQGLTQFLTEVTRLPLERFPTDFAGLPMEMATAIRHTIGRVDHAFAEPSIDMISTPSLLTEEFENLGNKIRAMRATCSSRLITLKGETAR